MDFFLHLLTPQPSNNHRAKMLHPSVLSALIAFLVLFQIFLTGMSRFEPQVLGYASSINVTDLLNDTNSKRTAAGVGKLTLNTQLANAAAGKARDMFTDQYWAHTSPSGKDPWAFIIGAGYNYTFAGENLARDFGDSHSVVDAWINSPSHRDNLLNSRFSDVGFAVVNGKYGDSETTLVVQMFGAQSQNAPTVAAPAVAAKPAPSPSSKEQPQTHEATSTTSAVPQKPSTQNPGVGVILNSESKIEKPGPLFDIPALTKTVSTLVLAILIVALVIDSVMVYQKKIVRLSGHNVAHLVFLIAVLIGLNIIGRGVIL